VFTLINLGIDGGKELAEGEVSSSKPIFLGIGLSSKTYKEI
jgi:hypothetical protein